MKLHKHFYVAIVILAVAAVSSEVYFRYLVELGAGEKVPLNKPQDPLASLRARFHAEQDTDRIDAPDEQFVQTEG